MPKKKKKITDQPKTSIKTYKGVRMQYEGGWTITLRVFQSPKDWRWTAFGTHRTRRKAMDLRRFYARRIALSYFRMLEMPYKTNTEINTILLSLPLRYRLVYFAIKESAKADRVDDRGVYIYSRVESAKKAELSMPYFLRYKRALFHAGLLATKKINGDTFCYFPEREQNPITDLTGI